MRDDFTEDKKNRKKSSRNNKICEIVTTTLFRQFFSFFSPSWSIPRKKLVTGIIFPIEALIWSQFGQIRETTADREAAVGGLLPAFKSRVVKSGRLLFYNGA